MKSADKPKGCGRRVLAPAIMLGLVAVDIAADFYALGKIRDTVASSCEGLDFGREPLKDADAPSLENKSGRPQLSKQQRPLNRPGLSNEEHAERFQQMVRQDNVINREMTPEDEARTERACSDVLSAFDEGSTDNAQLVSVMEALWSRASSSRARNDLLVLNECEPYWVDEEGDPTHDPTDLIRALVNDAISKGSVEIAELVQDTVELRCATNSEDPNDYSRCVDGVLEHQLGISASDYGKIRALLKE